MTKYYSILEMLDLVDEPNGSVCKKILEDNLKLFKKVQGSTNNHQGWPGGYYDHVQEIMNIAIVLYDKFDSIRRLPFSLSDLLLVVFLHDIEKPWKYELDKNGNLIHKKDMQTKDQHQNFRIKKLKEYGVIFTREHEDGIKYAEGELNDYTNKKRVMSPLACMAHMADVASARLWFDHPLIQNDSWHGAKRSGGE